MKRILGLMLSLTLCMTLLCGCQVQKGNYLKPVKLTESERELLTLTNPNLPILLNYHVEGAKSMAIEKMILKDGAWVKEEGSLFAMETDDASKSMEGRMALNYSTEFRTDLRCGAGNCRKPCAHQRTEQSLRLRDAQCSYQSE